MPVYQYDRHCPYEECRGQGWREDNEDPRIRWCIPCGRPFVMAEAPPDGDQRWGALHRNWSRAEAEA